MFKISLMLMVITLLFSTPLSFAHPELNYTQSFVKSPNGDKMYLEEPEKLKVSECDYMDNCFLVTLILVIMVMMVITIAITYRESYLRKW